MVTNKACSVRGRLRTLACHTATCVGADVSVMYAVRKPGLTVHQSRVEAAAAAQ